MSHRLANYFNLILLNFTIIKAITITTTTAEVTVIKNSAKKYFIASFANRKT